MIALFPDTNEYSVIPKNWIINSNDKKDTFCQWPPGNVDSDIIMQAEEPKDTWKIYRVKLQGNKTYSNDKYLYIIH